MRDAGLAERRMSDAVTDVDRSFDDDERTDEAAEEARRDRGREGALDELVLSGEQDDGVRQNSKYEDRQATNSLHETSPGLDRHTERPAEPCGGPAISQLISSDGRRIPSSSMVVPSVRE